MTVVILAALLALLISIPVVERSSTNPVEQYTDSWTKVNENFLFSDRLADWDKHKKPPARMRNLSEAEKAIDGMLKTLDDKYTRYYTRAEYTKRKQRAARTNVVSWKMLPDNIGYIKINTFSSDNVASEVEDALNSMQGAEAYIVDLRGNGGGYVSQAFSTFALFNESGVYETHRGRKDGKAFEDCSVLTTNAMEEYSEGNLAESRSRPQNLAGDKPVVILVNKNTASASESFSGAMRFNRGAILVGETTFGKGIMQRTYALDGGTAIKVTVAYIYQPDGNCIHNIGLEPDHSVDNSKRQDNQLNLAVEVAVNKVKAGN